ncbi:cortex morphogenetic protein CmpA [Alkalihalophilus sp. As8PL]|uniref:Cortex morphogenetic protein CmpA n=2 Tax=Alkalihalophilus TaxID=2893060 RepID=A0AB39BY99_9BACI|nr:MULTISPECIES: cortex morphogenetic protein CmpA [Bacillaceae]MDV2686500.1 cortex morphogenetic protein CmpA [Alkalihalophilus lindianensis]
MPTWLCTQLQRAFKEQNRHQIKILNQCWFYYQRKEQMNKHLG